MNLRNEFELKDRFDAVEFKLSHIQHNTEFFLDVIVNKKSNLLEGIIIGLLSIEIILSLVDMTFF